MIAALLAVLSPAAPGHMRAQVGSLVDLVQRSERILVGRPQPTGRAESGDSKYTVRVDVTLLGEASSESFEIVSRASFEPGVRQVFFLARTSPTLAGGGGTPAPQPRWHSLQKPGSVYPAATPDDGAYRAVVQAARAAADQPDDKAIAALRAALIPALQAKAESLRYHATLDLLATIHREHPLTPEERERLATVVHAPAFDAQLRPLLEPHLAARPR